MSFNREKDQDAADLGPPWTIIKILRWTAHFFKEQEASESPRLDAELLLSEILELPRVQMYTRFDQELSDEELSAYRALIKRRAAGEPIAYLLGRRDFYELTFKTDARALIPRPETELLVEAALERIDAAEEDRPLKVVDVGTGTGAIALSLAHARDDVQVTAVDVSADALELARKNAAMHDLQNRVAFFQGDLLDPLPEEWRPLDFVVSNPPYVAEEAREEVMIDVEDYEPHEALFAGADGLEVIRRLVPRAFDALRSGGRLLFEIGYDQGDAVRGLLAETGFDEIEILQDLSDHDRVAIGRRS